MTGWLTLFIAGALLTSGEDAPVRDPAERACAANGVHLLILGTYHMDNPGLDAVNVEADDVLSPRRQTEIAALNRALAAFRPTRVAVEADRGSRTWPDRYRAWLAGDRTPGRNEIEQVAMPVARAAGLESIEAIDFPMLMSGLRYDEIVFPPAPPPSAGPAAPRELSEEELLLRRLSVGDNLRRANDPARIAAGHRAYMDLLLPDPDDPAIYARSDRLLYWYKRNIRMMANLARVAGDGDRIFLLVGSGHLAILRDFALHSPRFCLVDTLAYLPPLQGEAPLPR